MVLLYKRDSLDGLTDAEKQHYKQTDGGFVLDIDDQNDERVQGLIKNRNEALAEKDKIQAQLKAFEGVDPEFAKNAQARLSTLEAELEKAKKSGNKASEDDIEKAIAQVKADYDAKLRERDEQINAFKTKTMTDAKNTAIAKALSDAGVRKGASDMMAAFLEKRVDTLAGESGQIAIRVKRSDGDGHELSTKDDSVYKTVSELVEDLRKNPEYGFAFEGSKGSGGGADGSRQDTTNGQPRFDGQFANVRSKADLRTPGDRVKFVRYLADKHGSDEAGQKAYFDLPDNPPS